MDGANNRVRQTIWLTIEQVAERLAVSPRTIRRLVASGDLSSVRVGRQLRFRSEDIDSYGSDDEPERAA